MLCSFTHCLDIFITSSCRIVLPSSACLIDSFNLFNCSGVINANHAVENKIGDGGKTDTNEQPDIKPEHATVNDLFSGYRISKEGTGQNDGNESIPEEFDLMGQLHDPWRFHLCYYRGRRFAFS